MPDWIGRESLARPNVEGGQAAQVEKCVLAQKSFAVRLLVIACSLLMAIAIWPACVAGDTGSDALPLPTIDEENLTESDDELLRQISLVDEFVYGVEQELLEAISDTEIERAQLFETLSEANPGADLMRMREVVQQTGPVDTLQSDRSTYLDFVKDLAARSRSYQAAIDSRIHRPNYGSKGENDGRGFTVLLHSCACVRGTTRLRA